ncbi:alpha/beta hydrolase [Azospirillum sp. TSO35-2]|uniref:alpha/beta hydrolase n=1 Tax=Azospirillum sp. TSO35-2 TaxID=716796 RepID=UPI000D60DAD0|nr:alpha/beta hydrolase [Azospirillum sp. TSO35-2]PWC31096.1 alpha/beta hydrolase [Azospirillum sp. TSO35-2]
MFFHTQPSTVRSGRAESARRPATGLVPEGAEPRAANSGAMGSGAMGSAAGDRAGDPWGRRVIFLHPGKGAWWRLLDHVPAGQEWLTIPAAASPLRLTSLLVERNGRKPVLVAGAVTAALAIAAALDHPDAVGGVMIIDDVGAESPLRRRWNTLAARFGRVVPDALGELEAELAAVKVPVTLMQGNDPVDLFERLESGLTGCRTLTVVAVPGAAAVRPRTHAGELRGALAALVAAVERASR